MRLIGLVGGTTWLSTAEYYRHLNEMVAQRRGGLHSARVLLHSIDFADVIACGRAGDVDGEAAILIDAARSVERGGAQLLALCANTAHVHAAAVAGAVSIPLVHIADEVAKEVRRSEISTIGVLCTGRTRQAGIFDDALSRAAGCSILMPSDSEQERLDAAILNTAAEGGVSDETRALSVDLVRSLRARGAAGIVLGCTELPIMLGTRPADELYFDTTLIHARALVELALA